MVLARHLTISKRENRLPVVLTSPALHHHETSWFSSKPIRGANLYDRCLLREHRRTLDATARKNHSRSFVLVETGRLCRK